MGVAQAPNYRPGLLGNWCGPCVASIPNLNQLIQETDPNRVVFLSIDDEDPFLCQDIRGEKGIAEPADRRIQKGKILRSYGVSGRPSVIVVNGEWSRRGHYKNRESQRPAAC